MVRKREGKKIWQFIFKSFLEDREKILFVIHKHPVLHFKNFAQVAFFGLFIPFALWFLFPQTLMFAIIWGTIGVVRLISEFAVWYFDLWLVTDMNIIDIDQKSVFEKSSTRLEYHHIETITYEINGMEATIFNFGDIIIEKTTGNKLKFKGAFRPKHTVRRLNEYQEKFATDRTFTDHATLKNLISDMLHTHVKKHGVPQNTRRITETEEV